MDLRSRKKLSRSDFIKSKYNNEKITINPLIPKITNIVFKIILVIFIIL